MIFRSHTVGAALCFSIFTMTVGVSISLDASNQNVGNPAARPVGASAEASAVSQSSLQYYRSLASEMAARYQFNQRRPASFPGSITQPVWTPPLAWLEQKVTADDGQANDLMGFRVLISGDTAFVSAPAPIYRPGSLYVFKKVAGSWTQTQKLVATPDVTPPPNWSDFFGWSLALSGNTLIVGAPFTFDLQGPTGAAFVFTESNGVWTQTAQLKASDGVAIDYFGQAVGLAGDTAVVGAYNRNGGEGAAYVFTNSGGVWSQTQEMTASDGLPGDSHQFGEALAFNGAALIIGAPGPDYVSTGVYPQGAAYVFKRTAGSWSETQKLTAADGAAGDQFGFAIELSSKIALIGAPAANIGGNAHQGAAYVFWRSNGAYAQNQKLVASDGVAYDQFGQSVDLQGRTAIIGEWSHDDDFTHVPPPPKEGMSYIFRRANAFWEQTQQLSASDGELGDSFGWDVAVDGDVFLIGAQGTVDGNMYQGAAYFYDRGSN